MFIHGWQHPISDGSSLTWSLSVFSGYSQVLWPDVTSGLESFPLIDKDVHTSFLTNPRRRCNLSIDHFTLFHLSIAGSRIISTLLHRLVIQKSTSFPSHKGLTLKEGRSFPPRRNIEEKRLHGNTSVNPTWWCCVLDTDRIGAGWVKATQEVPRIVKSEGSPVRKTGVLRSSDSSDLVLVSHNPSSFKIEQKRSQRFIRYDDAGAIPPIAEMQAQLFILLAEKRIPIPVSPETYHLLHSPTSRIQYGVDYSTYMSTLAKDIGSAPGLLKLWWEYGSFVLFVYW